MLTVRQDLLRESLRLGKTRIHQQLALQYVAAADCETRRRVRIAHVFAWCAVDRHFCAAVFAQEVARPDCSEAILLLIYEAWHTRNGNPDAGVAWARWLLSHQEGARAMEVIGRTRGAEWASVLDHVG